MKTALVILLAVSIGLNAYLIAEPEYTQAARQPKEMLCQYSGFTPCDGCKLLNEYRNEDALEMESFEAFGLSTGFREFLYSHTCKGQTKCSPFTVYVARSEAKIEAIDERREIADILDQLTELNQQLSRLEENNGFEIKVEKLGKPRIAEFLGNPSIIVDNSFRRSEVQSSTRDIYFIGGQRLVLLRILDFKENELEKVTKIAIAHFLPNE